jgi:peptide deformylase
MIKPIVTDISILKRPCVPVTKNDDIKQIIIDLKETLQSHSIGWGLAANQIGYDKAICYIRVPKTINHKEKKITYAELVLINPKIIEKDTPVKVNNEGCLSFEGINVTTKRYIYITAEFLDENLKPQAAAFQDYESLAIQHEVSHLEGKTIFDFKWRAK